MTFLRVIAFSVVVLLAYTLFANILPQVQSDPPKEDKPVDAAKLDKAGMVAWGARLFEGKGACTLCHNKMGRAPDLLKLDLAKVLPERIGDKRYEGVAKGKSGAAAIEAYLRESLVKPSVYVVAGFGKKGTNDKVSPMQPVDKAPINLRAVEVDAVIAFLQDKAGVEVTVPLPKQAAPKKVAKKPENGDDDDEEKLAETAEAALKKFNCVTCHDLLGSKAEAGPKLGDVGKRLGRSGLVESILKPNATIAKGFEPDQMPQEYASEMRVSELNLIVDYLMKLDAKPGGAAPGKKKTEP